MFDKKNFKILEQCIHEVCTANDGSVKAGLKRAYYYMLKTSSKTLKGTYLISDEEDK